MLDNAAEVVVLVVWLILALVLGVMLVQLVCLTIALYEAVNLPESEDVGLTTGALVGTVRRLLGEMLAMLGIILATPLGYLPWRPVPRLAADERPPLVLVAGLRMNRGGLWLLRHRLRGDGWSHAIGLEWYRRGDDLLAAAVRLGEAVERLTTESGAPAVIVVAHGIGGIVCRAYLRYLGGTARVRAAITLGTAHQGSKLFALSLDPLVRAVRAGSPLLRDLAADDPVPAAVDFTAIYSQLDAVVVPASQAYYAGAGNIAIESVGHLGLLWSARVYELVRENLDYHLAVRAQPSASNAATQRSTSVSSE